MVPTLKQIGKDCFDVIYKYDVDVKVLNHFILHTYDKKVIDNK